MDDRSFKPPLISGPLRDALWLIQKGFTVDAIFPFRYSAVRTFVWADIQGVTDIRLDSILATAFAEGVEIPPLVNKLLDNLMLETKLLIEEDALCD